MARIKGWVSPPLTSGTATRRHRRFLSRLSPVRFLIASCASPEDAIARTDLTTTFRGGFTQRAGESGGAIFLEVEHSASGGAADLNRLIVERGTGMTKGFLAAKARQGADCRSALGRLITAELPQYPDERPAASGAKLLSGMLTGANSSPASSCMAPKWSSECQRRGLDCVSPVRDFRRLHRTIRRSR